jgi:hypothetical protein
MARRKQAKDDEHTRIIRSALEHEYMACGHPRARIDVKRYNSVSVWVRIIDADFRELSKAERDDLVWNALERLPEELYSQVTMLFLFTPEEAKSSIMNIEFEDPTPSPV